jgi:hypothetical protein
MLEKDEKKKAHLPVFFAQEVPPDSTQQNP